MSRRRNRGRNIHGILLLDKATGMTSNRALQDVKRLFDARKAGHTGSLDPLATGMLPICFGEATKISHYLLDADKEYLAGARFGSTTDTADRDGTVLDTMPLPENFSDDLILSAIQPLLGNILQVPPMYSALKHQGKRLYTLARQGETVERKARPVTIFSASLESLKGDLAMIRVRCSKGTYIRTLIEDIGAAIGCGAHIDSLRRVSVSPFDALNMMSEDQLQAELTGWSTRVPEGLESNLQSSPVASSERAILDKYLLPIDKAINHLPAVSLDPVESGKFFNGQPVEASLMTEGTLKGQSVRVYNSSGEFSGIAEIADNRGRETGVLSITPKRVLNL